MEHSYSLSQHQLGLGQCPAGCQYRSQDQSHWHEQCHCGVEYVLSHDLEDPSSLVLVAVYDHQEF